MRTREAIREAKERGRQAGKNAASWAFDGNTPDDAIEHVYDALQAGDDTGIETPSWLSGEWAGASVSELLGDVLEATPEDSHDDVMLAYEEAADAAFWEAIERDVTARMAPDDGRVFNANAYTTPRFAGIALHVVGRNRVTGAVRVVMVGDDEVYEVEANDLRALHNSEYCADCGQVGCAHGARGDDDTLEED